jgi:hypothetical protein
MLANLPRKSGRATKKTVKRLLPIPKVYMEAIPVGQSMFPTLYQFENGLRLAIDKHLSTCYGPNWWEVSLKTNLPTIYDYAEDAKTKRASMPWIGSSARTTVLPIHLVTLGHLEEIVKKYEADCIPSLFPTKEFFLGHMECIKRVRNLYSHMFPCLDKQDTRLVKSEVRVLAWHLRTKL